MLIICLAVLAASLAVNVAGFIGVRNAVNQNFGELSEGLHNMFAEPSPGEPSNFIRIVDQITDSAAEKLRISVMAADRGAQGAATRDINRGLEEIAVENNPAYAVASNMPRSLKKNPIAMAGLNILMQKMLAGSGIPGPGSPAPGNNGGSSQQVKFDL